MTNRQTQDTLRMIENITIHDIGCKVRTPCGVGILIDVDAGAAFYVQPLNKNEEWEDYQFECKELEKLDNNTFSK